MSMDAMLAKVAPFGNQNILFVDAVYDQMGVADQIQEPGLRPYVIYSMIYLRLQTQVYFLMLTMLPLLPADCIILHDGQERINGVCL